MYYHAKLTYSSKDHYWWNYSREEIVSLLVAPFINGQVIEINLDGHTSLLNMKSVTLLRIYKTAKKLTTPDSLLAPSELSEIGFEINDCTREIIQSEKINKSSADARSLLEKNFIPIENQVFIIMRIGDRHLDSAYTGVIKPVIESFGLKAIRIDEVQNAGKISDQILETIAKSRYVFADLSGERPNCYYETGFAHALGKDLILSIRKEDTIHFDLSGYRFIIWETESDLRNSLRQRLEGITTTHS
jgi:hypothetical protein